MRSGLGYRQPGLSWSRAKGDGRTLPRKSRDVGTEDRRHTIELAGGLGEAEITDSFAFDSRVLAEIQGASVLGRVATGPRAGDRVMRRGGAAAATIVISRGPRHAHLDGFDLLDDAAIGAIPGWIVTACVAPFYAVLAILLLRHRERPGELAYGEAHA